MPRKYRLDKLEMPDLEAMEPLVRKAVFKEGLKLIADWLRAHVPDSGVAHKGKLNKSIRYSVKAGGLLGTVRAVAPHAHLIHEGVRGHWTLRNPRRQPMVRGLPIAGVGWRTKAWHPGLRANPFLTRAADENMDAVVGVMRAATEAAAQAVADGATA